MLLIFTNVLLSSQLTEFLFVGLIVISELMAMVIYCVYSYRLVRFTYFILGKLYDPPEEKQLIAVKNQSYHKIYYPTEKVSLKAIEQDIDVFRSIITIGICNTESLIGQVLQKYPLQIKFIKYPTKKQQLIAVKQDRNSIQFIENPYEEVKLLAL